MTPTQRLPLLKVIWGTFAFPWMFRGPWFRAVSLPLLALIGAILAWNLIDETTAGMDAGVVHIVYLAATSWLAVRTHRLVLLGPEESRAPDLLSETRFVGLYLATLAGLWLVWFGLATLLGALAASGILIATSDLYVPAGTPPPEFDPKIQTLIDYGSAVATLPAAYMVARLSPLLPAIALGRGWSPRTAWQMSRGNGWRLAAAVLGLPYAFAVLMELLSRDDASGVEIALFAITCAFIAALEVIAMSLAYRELEPPELPPTDPPA